MDKQMKRNKICFGLGTVGRDALYSLVSMYLLVHLTDVVGFSDGGLAVIGIMLTLFGIFDAVIDPFVGAVVDSTKTKWGKFKPWILIGMIGTGILSVLMFHNIRMGETAHIVLLGVTYLLFSIFFSLNDIAYWSLMPAISKDQKVREGVGAFARICANVGMFSMVLIYLNVPSMFSFLNMSDRDVYFIFAIITALIMWAFQSVTLFGVKEDRSRLEKEERTTLKDLWRALIGNDQLMVTAVSMALFMIGYCTTTAFGTYYFKYAYGDEGMYMVFAAVLAVAQLTALSVFPLFRKKFTRKQLYTGSMISVTISYVIFFLSFEWLPLIVIAGLGLFFAQAFIQLLMLLFLADAVEYGEWKLGKRNEAASFAVQPFINQFGGAASKGIVSFTLIISGINMIANDIAANPANEAEIIATMPELAVWIMKISMMILPLICILIGFFLYIKKFKIDEETYANILADLKAREEAQIESEANGDTQKESHSIDSTSNNN
ncbi:MAG: sugar transporter [Ruminococcaceae bacterium]|nr:sugar transporter [Oscillospiraceae bacterium]